MCRHAKFGDAEDLINQPDWRLPIDYQDSRFEPPTTPFLTLINQHPTTPSWTPSNILTYHPYLTPLPYPTPPLSYPH